jgi:hypothetical protein
MSSFGTAQPGKPGVQQGDGCGRRFLGRRGERDGCRRRRQKGDPGAAGALIAPVGSAAPRSEAAALQKGFVEENVRGVGHGLSSDTTFALVRDRSKEKVLQI